MWWVRTAAAEDEPDAARMLATGLRERGFAVAGGPHRVTGQPSTAIGI
jgi:hypothetical protein